ncbi:hypothetical protein [Haloferula sp. BvORR071]|uniref:hypothetical protein n=1 Tax=Haloferula sp. BvORR071 TaxID=1396141 RepID=UPI000695BF37|nr:hypothetical protein [Haloferula sp. BvORR071]
MAVLASCLVTTLAAAEKLDREAIVRRNQPVLEKADKLTPFGLGLPGADFVFTADVTGLQTLADFHRDGQDLNTMAGWAWHEFPNPENFTLADCTAPHAHLDGTQPYSPMNPPAGLSAEKTERWKKAAAWLRANPHRISLGRIGFVHPDGSAIAVTDLTKIHQEMDLWSGVLHSSFVIDGSEVKVTTVPATGPEGIATRIESGLLEDGRLALQLDFPGPSGEWGATGKDSNPDAHRSELTSSEPNHALIARSMDGTRYATDLTWTGTAAFEKQGPHRFLLKPHGVKSLDVHLAFSPDPKASNKSPGFDATIATCRKTWLDYWTRGGIVDFSGSTDPHAKELERRVILSLYLAAIHCAGPNPPQETGNARNSWFGKFHMEMLPWHAAHFALWGHPEILDRQLHYYRRILPKARETAASQGCKGARWPKMTDPSGSESPSDIGVFLAWQQPHPIYLAELVRRAKPGNETLTKHREIVFASADFLASFPHREADGKLHLVPPLIPAQECYKPAETRDPAYELAYFRWAIGIARQWRADLGEAPDPAWESAWKDLAPLPVVEDRYATVSGPPFTLYHDHPCVLMICGWLPPAADLDKQRFSRTFDDIAAKWEWPTTWGWDPPVLAMAAARIGRTSDAVNELLRDTPRNGYLANGHNYLDTRLPLYLPGNGGLLHAVAMMAGGWDGAPDRPAPGFPADGTWRVRVEGLLPAP